MSKSDVSDVEPATSTQPETKARVNMAIPVEMPKMSDTMEEGVVVAWMVDEGHQVSAGDVIAQVETDKATMDLEVYDDGVLLKRVINEGDAVPIGGLIAILGSKDEDISELLARYSVAGDGAVAPSAGAADSSEHGSSKGESEHLPEMLPTEPSDSGAMKLASVESGRLRSSPLARKLAADHGIDLRSVSGTGPEGRIIKRDIEARLGSSPALSPGRALPDPALAPTKADPVGPKQAPPVSVLDAVVQRREEGGYESVRISQMRKAISRRLSESKFTSPHFYLTADFDMGKAVAARVEINVATEQQGLAKVSFNDLITKACALALKEHRWVNASYMEVEGEVRLHDDVHVAVAVAVDEGLITPVIRHADRKGLSEIAAETRNLAERARAKELEPEEYSGSTFTTSNLGMFGIEEFTAIINPPNACILAIGAIRDLPVVVDGAVIPGKRMKVTLSCDHRVVDGASGARFLATVGGYIEDPLTMLL